jgi:hypothetical protein
VKCLGSVFKCLFLLMIWQINVAVRLDLQHFLWFCNSYPRRSIDLQWKGHNHHLYIDFSMLFGHLFFDQYIWKVQRYPYILRSRLLSFRNHLPWRMLYDLQRLRYRIYKELPKEIVLMQESKNLRGIHSRRKYINRISRAYPKLLLIFGRWYLFF